MENQQNNRVEETTQEKFPLNEELTQEIVKEIQTLQEKGDREGAMAVFSDLHPADQGEVMEALSIETQQEILTTLPPHEAAEILKHLEPENVAKVSEGVDSSVLSDILKEADSDVSADILKQLPEQQSKDVLAAMEETEDVVSLLQYPDDSAGGIMVLEFVAVNVDMTAAAALDALRLREPEVEDIRSVFVVNDEARLVGSLSVTRLALARLATPVSDILDPEILFVSSDTDQEECARVMERYSLDQLPVVDNEKRLIGVILSEDILGVVNEEATEDMYKLAGIGGEKVFGPLKTSIRNRFPWLSINLAT
ncbi:MAG: CBS domain-containing protein, partial [Dehalococcoidia bacterium]|nr:CBS domain-containing protein [Dehalococcoidia bacterium]